MKHHYLTSYKMKSAGILAGAVAVALCGGAEKLDLRSMSEIRQHVLQGSDRPQTVSSRVLKSLRADAKDKAAVRDAFVGVQTRSDEVVPSVTLAFITIADGYTADDLRNEGVDVLKVMENLAIVQVAIRDAERVSSLDAVKAMSLQKKMFASMDLARAETGVDYIHSGSKEQGLTVPYTGAGVITALVDQGVDAKHINFRLPNNDSRIGFLTHLRINSTGTGIAETNYNETNIQEFTTDTPSAYHGTHTLGIFAGGYDGPVKVGTPWANPQVPEPANYITENCKFYGVAPGSNIAVSCGDLSDIFIGYGMEYLLGYSEYLERPIVYNLSLGSNAGPHDPRSQMSQFLDLVGERAIVCLSAGNEGDLKIALKKTFSEGDESFKTMIYPYAYQYDASNPNSQTIRYGSISIYSDDERPFKLKAVIYNKNRGYRQALAMPVAGEGVGTYYCSSTDYQMDTSDIIGDATFKKAFDGYVGVGGKVDEQTGRYYGMVDYYVMNNTATNLNDDYVLGFEVEGEPGQRIECYGDGLTTWMDNYGVDGFTDGSMDGTISDMAVGHNILVVGSYNTRNSWVCLDGGTSSYLGDGFKPGGVSSFSSFGTLSDGRELPHVCAPGAAIISSISTPYAQLTAQQYGEDYLDYMCSAKLEEEGRTNYWKQEVGTSMATPFVAGSIALWLEANPDLTIEQVKEIVKNTAIRDEQVENTPEQVRWGAGKFNALAGLKEAIRLASGINGIEADNHNDRLILSREGDRIFKVFVGGADSLNVRIFSTDGSLVFGTSGEGDEVTADLSSLASGIYVINVNGRHSEKIYLK